MMIDRKEGAAKMIEVLKKYYTFAELSDDVKQKVSYSDFWQNEIDFLMELEYDNVLYSFKKYGELLEIEINTAEISAYDSITELSGGRALAYISNHVELKELKYDIKQRRVKIQQKMQAINLKYSGSLYPYKPVWARKTHWAEIDRFATAKNNYEDNFLTGVYTDGYFFDALETFILQMRNDKTLTLLDFLELWQSYTSDGLEKQKAIIIRRNLYANIAKLIIFILRKQARQNIYPKGRRFSMQAIKTLYAITAGAVIVYAQNLIQPVKITPLELIIILIGVTAIASI